MILFNFYFQPDFIDALSPSRTLPIQHHHQSYYQPNPTSQHSHGHHRSHTSRRSASSGSDLLQTKLRRLLNTDSKDLVTSSTDDILIPPPQLSPNSPYFISHHQSPKNFQQQLTVHPEQQSDVTVFFPSAFLSPQSLPPHPTDDLDDLYSYGIDDDDNLILTDNYRPISPPAEYAQKNSPPKNEKIKKEKNRYDYQRSYSHHQQTNLEGDYAPMSGGSGGSRGSRTSRDYADSRGGSNQQNINSHKSLPDLHTQISRHSPHSEALSCCSRGNRSNRSAGSSFNRDSGGSSGHYTHRSEPKKISQGPPAPIIHPQEYRRDSGSSTQHSGNSYYAYGNQQFRYDCIECRAKMRADVECLLNFPTPEVPEAFQDDYQDDSTDKNNKTATIRNTYYNQQSSVVRSPTPPSPQELLSPRSGQNIDLSPPLGTFKRQKCLRFKNFRGRYSNTSTSVMAQTSSSQPNSIQCIEDDRRPILRSKSDISDRYWNRLQQQQMQLQQHHQSHKSKDELYHQEQHKSERSNSGTLNRRERYGGSAGTGSCGSTGSVGSSGGQQSGNMSNIMSKSESMYELEHFFDRLGLDDDKYAEIIEAQPIKKHQRSASATVPPTYCSDNESDSSSAVFFSDVSTIDSNRIQMADQATDTIVTASNTQQGPQNTQTNLYRPNEPNVSIVERNARIIKWLCNCKKMQLL